MNHTTTNTSNGDGMSTLTVTAPDKLSQGHESATTTTPIATAVAAAVDVAGELVDVTATTATGSSIDNAVPANESSMLLLRESKYCRICLEEEEDEHGTDDEPMIAPCLCKGSAKWVHRSCLDQWRMNEPDRAFAQCTECQYNYQLLVSTKHDMMNDVESCCSWNQSQMKFCCFVSRDICTVTIVLQLLIAFFGATIRILDHHVFHWELTHLFYPPNNKCNFTSYQYDDKCRQEEIAIYYLFGIFAVLAIIGMTGSILFCRNGCRIPSIKDHVNNDGPEDIGTLEYVSPVGDTTTATDTTKKAINYHDTATPVTNEPDIERGCKYVVSNIDDTTKSSSLPFEPRIYPNPIQQHSQQQQRRSTEYYRRQRQLQHDRSNSETCCEDETSCCCCLSSISSGTAVNRRRTNATATCSDRCTTTNHYCLYTNCFSSDGRPFCCDTYNNSNGHMNDDGGCCYGCCCPDHHSSTGTAAMDAHHCCNCDCCSGGGGGDNAMAPLLFIILLFFVIFAVIGLFFMLVIGVIVCQRICQRYLFLLQKQTLVQEFQVADLSLSEGKSSTNYSSDTNQPYDPLLNKSRTDRFTDVVTLPGTRLLRERDIERLQKLGLLDGRKITNVIQRT